MQLSEVKTAFKNIQTTYKSNKNAIALLGDSLEILNDIKSQSIDLIFADPPYGIGKDFGISKDIFANANEYLEWCKVWIDSCMRNLKA